MPFTKILATGKCVPETIRDNFYFERELGTDLENGGTTDEWIRTRTGIIQRRVAAPHETHEFMGTESAKDAHKKTSIPAKDISVILAGNTHRPGLIPCEASRLAIYPDMAAFDIITRDPRLVAEACSRLFNAYTICDQHGPAYGDIGNKESPTEAIVYQHADDGLAAKIARQLGMNAQRSFDICTGCASFNYGLALADTLIRAEPQYIMVVAVDDMIKVTNPNDRATIILFGVLAGAALLGPSETPGFIAHQMRTDGTQRDMIKLEQAPGEDKPYFKQNGRAVYKWAMPTMEELTRFTVDTAVKAKAPGRIYLVPHQANPRMLEDAMKRSIFNQVEGVVQTGAMFGNSSTASIAHGLDVALTEGIPSRIVSGDSLIPREGDYIGIMGFGAGLSDAVNVYRVA